MANVASLEVASDRVKELKRDVQDLAIETGTSTTVVSEGLYQVISAFGDSAESAELLAISAKSAKAGLATVTDSINLTSAVTKAYGDTSAEAVQSVADMALQTVALGQTTFPELASSIGRVTPLTKELGVSQAELFGTMATLTGVTGSAAEVSTQLRGGLQALMAPTKATSALFEEMGVSSGAALIEQKGLHGALTTLTDAAAKSGKPLQEFIGSVEGQVLALALAGPQADVYAQKLKEVENASGAANKAFEAQTEGINKSGATMARVRARLEVLSQNVGDALAPALDTALSHLEPLIEGLSRFAENNPGIVATVAAITGVVAALGVAAVAIGSVITAIGTIISVGASFLGFLGGVIAAINTIASFIALFFGSIVTVVLSPLALLVAGVAAAVAAIIIHWESVKAAFASVGAMISSALSSAGSAMSSFGSRVASVASSAISSFSSMVAAASAAGAGIVSGFMSAVGGVASAMASIVSSVLGALSGLASQAFSMGANIVSSIASGIASGVGKVAAAASSVAGAVRNMLPNSPVPEGPLTILNRGQAGEKISAMIAGGIEQGKGLVSNAASSAVSPVALAANAGGSRGGGSASINYSPTINIGGNVSSEQKQDFMNMLRQHKDELMSLIGEASMRDDWLSYS